MADGDKISTVEDATPMRYLYLGYKWLDHSSKLVNEFEVLEDTDGVLTRTGKTLMYANMPKSAPTFWPGYVYTIPTEIVNGNYTMWFGAKHVKTGAQWPNTLEAEAITFASRTARQQQVTYNQQKKNSTDLKEMDATLRPLLKVYNGIKTTQGRIAFEVLLIQRLRERSY